MLDNLVHSPGSQVLIGILLMLIGIAAEGIINVAGVATGGILLVSAAFCCLHPPTRVMIKTYWERRAS